MCNALHPYAPGRVLIDEGVDDHSHAGVVVASGPASSYFVRAHARQLVAACGWALTVAAFASEPESNSLLPRFFARFSEPQAEAEDAFTVPGWACSTCQACGALHHETLFVFSPQQLINSFVAKARADGARAIMVTPLSVSVPYWNKLLQASVFPNETGYYRIRRQAVDVDSNVRG